MASKRAAINKAPHAEATLVGEDGPRTAELLARCALGRRPLSDLGGAAFRDSDGTLALRVDDETFETLRPPDK